MGRENSFSFQDNTYRRNDTVRISPNRGFGVAHNGEIKEVIRTEKENEAPVVKVYYLDKDGDDGLLWFDVSSEGELTSERIRALKKLKLRLSVR